MNLGKIQFTSQDKKEMQEYRSENWATRLVIPNEQRPDFKEFSFPGEAGYIYN